MKTTKVLTGLLALALAGSACFGRHGVGSAFKAGAPTGRVEALRAGASSWETLAEGERVAPGSEVRTAAGSGIVLQRDDGASIELGPSSDVRVTDVRRLALQSGRVLAAVRENALAIDAEGVVATAAKSVYRVDSGFSVRVGSYGGSIDVAQDTQRVTVGDFAQVEIAGGVFPRGTVPLRISATDGWDQKILADAFFLDGELRKYGRVFKADFGSQARDPDFYTKLVPGLSVTQAASALRSIADPADFLFAVLMARREAGAVGTLLGGLIDLRLAGATWGLIAKTKHISMKEYLALVISTLTPVQPGGSPGTAPTGGGTPGGGRNTGGGEGGSPSPGGSPTPSHSPTPSPSPSPSQSPSPSPTPCSAIDQLLGRCGPGVL